MFTMNGFKVSSMISLLPVVVLCLLVESAVAQEDTLLGYPRVMSREYPKNPILGADRYTPRYGLDRTTNYLLRTTPSVADRLKKNLFRSPELLIAAACCLCCLAWALLACCVTLCFGRNYQCAMDSEHYSLFRSCLHWWACCFVCHYCKRGMKDCEDEKNKESNKEVPSNKILESICCPSSYRTGVTDYPV